MTGTQSASRKAGRPACWSSAGDGIPCPLTRANTIRRRILLQMQSAADRPTTLSDQITRSQNPRTFPLVAVAAPNSP